MADFFITDAVVSSLVAYCSQFQPSEIFVSVVSVTL